MRWTMVTLLGAGCAEASWLSTRMPDEPLPFAAGQAVRDVDVRIAIAEGALPERERIIGDALRMSAQGIGPYEMTFLVDDEPITDSSRLREFQAGNANLLDVTRDCGLDAVCVVDVVVRIERERRDERVGAIGGDYFISVQPPRLDVAPPRNAVRVEIWVR